MVQKPGKKFSPKTAFLDTLEYGHTAIVQALLAKGANVNAHTETGTTALILAALIGNTESVKALLAKDADVQATDKNGSTALMLAAEYGRMATVEALLAKGTDVRAKDEDGSTALRIANKQGYSQIVQLLKQVLLAKDDWTASMVAAEITEPQPPELKPGTLVFPVMRGDQIGEIYVAGDIAHISSDVNPAIRFPFRVLRNPNGELYKIISPRYFHDTYIGNVIKNGQRGILVFENKAAEIDPLSETRSWDCPRFSHIWEKLLFDPLRHGDLACSIRFSKAF